MTSNKRNATLCGVAAIVIALVAVLVPARAWSVSGGAASGGAASSGTVSNDSATDKGTITINVTEGASKQLLAYQIFSADVVDADSVQGSDQVSVDGKVLSNLCWASDAMQDAVVGAIESVDANYSSTLAQDAADWLQANVTSDAANAATAESVPVKIAERIAQMQANGEDAPESVAVTAGATVTLNEGYWLFVSDDSQVGTGESGTSPILAVVGGSAVTATVKTAVPSVSKQVLEDSNNTWQKQADATVGDDLYWRLTASVPAGLNSYKSYAVSFYDTPSDGLNEPSDVRAYVTQGSADDGSWTQGSAPSGWAQLDEDEFTVVPAAGADGSSFQVQVGDLVATAARHGLDFGSGLRVCVVYSAPLSSSANHGMSEGNPNTVVLRYPRSPFSTSYAQTQEDSAIAYTWDLQLVKRDSSSDEALAGAVLRVTDDRGRHLTQDGAWTSENATVTTDSEGKVYASGVDAGTFDVEEVSAPEGYQAFSGSRRVTLSVAYDAQSIVHTPVTYDFTAESPLRADSFDKSVGLAQASVLNDSNTGLWPPTGTSGGSSGGTAGSGSKSGTAKMGDTFAFGLVGALMVAGAIAVAASRRLRRGGGDS